jgi:hypothetical protein
MSTYLDPVSKTDPSGQDTDPGMQLLIVKNSYGCGNTIVNCYQLPQKLTRLINMI